MTNLEAIDTVRGLLLKRYPDYFSKSYNERIVLCSAVVCDDLKIREATGHNDGPWVQAILAGVELKGDYSWCVALIRFYFDVAKIATPGLSDRSSAGVSEWIRWARSMGLIVSNPVRGGGCFKKSQGISHGAIAVGSALGWTRTAEGNTSPGEKGSQQNGGGAYRRNRRTAFWDVFTDWNKLVRA